MALREGLKSQQAEDSSAELGSVVHPTVPYDLYFARPFTYVETMPVAEDGVGFDIIMNVSSYIWQIDNLVTQKVSGTWSYRYLSVASGRDGVIDMSGTGPNLVNAEVFGSGNGYSHIMNTDKPIDLWLWPGDTIKTEIYGFGGVGSLTAYVSGRAWPYKPD